MASPEIERLEAKAKVRSERGRTLRRNAAVGVPYRINIPF